MFSLIKDKRIRRKLHRVGTYDVCKISSLSCFDYKRYILDDDSSLAFFS